MQRKLMFYIEKMEMEFRLQVIQISPPLYQFEDRALNYLFRHADESFADMLKRDVARMNQLKDDSTDAADLYASYWVDDESRALNVIDDCDRNTQYAVKVEKYRLPLNAKDLAKFLIGLDASLHTQVYIHHTKGVVVEFCLTPPNMARPAEFCHYALAAKNENERVPNEFLSRFVANFIVEELSKQNSAAEVQPHKDLIEFLQLMLAKKGSLTPLIRQYLYPAPSVASQIESCCAQADPLAKKLLDPDCDLSTKTQELYQFIRAKLWTKPNLPKQEAEMPAANPTMEIIEDEPALKLRDEARMRIHGEIKAWFDSFSTYKKTMWIRFIETLYGKLADDQGFYNENYTEINLLKEASLVHHPNGCFELVFKKESKGWSGCSYQEKYAVGQKLHDKIGDELTAACGDLDLHFIPNQDFHVSAIFDPESSNRLRQRGFHIDEVHCKEQMRFIIAKQQFKLRVTNSPFRAVPSDLLPVIMGWVNEGHREDVRQKLEETQAKMQAQINKGIRLIM